MQSLELAKILINIQPYLQRYAKLLTRDTDKAKELVSEVFIKALVKQPNFKQELAFKRWCAKTLKNMFLNDIQETALHIKLSQEYYDIIFKRAEDVPLLIKEKLHKLIDALDTEEQICIDLHYFQKRSYRQIAPHLGVTFHQVGQILQQAREKLKHRLNEEGIKGFL